MPALKNGGCKEQALRPEAGTPALNNGYGGFLRDGSYLCYRMPPVPWCNVLVGAGLGAVMTDRGPGLFTQEQPAGQADSASVRPRAR